MKAYKVFDENWKCRDFKYEIGKRYVMNKEPILYEQGFHACAKLINCFSYYDFNNKNKVAIVELHGDIIGDKDDKYATNDIEIIKEISWYEVLEMVNMGIGNTGHRNAGDRNTGDWNTGDWNTGDWNTGNSNTGDSNTGDSNTGDRNTGDRNTGDWNSGSYNVGDFNTIIPDKVLFFNKWISWEEFRGIRELEAYEILNKFKFIKYRVRRITGKYGDYRYMSYKNSFRYFWRNLTLKERKTIKEMPYFDKDVFYEITGVK